MGGAPWGAYFGGILLIALAIVFALGVGVTLGVQWLAAHVVIHCCG